MPWWGWLLIAWLPIGIPLGIVLGKYMAGIDRHYPVAPTQAPRSRSVNSGPPLLLDAKGNLIPVCIMGNGHFFACPDKGTVGCPLTACQAYARP